MQRRSLGIDGERAAARWYERAGYEIVDRNWRCRHGEIDLVATSGRRLVVCEVKTRTSDRFGTGAEAVDRRKQQTIRRVTAMYLAQRCLPAPRSIRFDVAVVRPGPNGWTVEVIEHAF